MIVDHVHFSFLIISLLIDITIRYLMKLKKQISF